MIPRAGVLNGGRVAAVFNRNAVTHAAAALLVTAAVCVADDANGGSGGSDKNHIALNQGVSIEQIVPDADAGDGFSTGGPLRSDEEASRDGRHEVGNSGQRRSKPRVTPGVHTARRARLSRDAPGASGAQSTPSYLTGLGALAVVLVLIGLAAWAVKRWMPAARGGGSGVLQIVGRANLSAKHTLALVQIGRRFVMVGVAGDRVTALCEVSDPDEVAELAARVDTSDKQAGPGFDHLLHGEAACYREVAEHEAEGGRSSVQENVQDAQGNYPARGREAFAVRQLEPVKDRMTGRKPRKPLNDLLRRLRTLHTT